MTETAVSVLLAEDDPDIRAITCIALEQVAGMAVTACADGAGILEAFAAAVPDVVVLDVMMPGMDGPDVLAALRDLPGGESVPVLFMTARVRPEDVARYRALGAAGVIAKPFDPMTLGDEIRRLAGLLGEAVHGH
jgi:CheY-like chemotaxis protein